MSDRTVSLTVVLDKDYRVDDIDSILNAIRMVKGVINVDANVADSDTYIAYTRARYDLSDRLWKALNTEKNKS